MGILWWKDPIKSFVTGLDLIWTQVHYSYQSKRFAEIWFSLTSRRRVVPRSAFVTLSCLISKPQNCGKMCVMMAAWCEDRGKCEGRQFGMSQRNPVIMDWLNLLQKTKFFFMNLCWYFFLGHFWFLMFRDGSTWKCTLWLIDLWLVFLN